MTMHPHPHPHTVIHRLSLSPSPMAKTRNSKTLTKNDQVKLKKPPSWAVVRSIFTCKHTHFLQVQQQKTTEKAPQQQNVQQNNHKVQQQPQPIKENSKNKNKKKSKKVMCSGSLCNNTKIMHKPEPHSPEDKKKKKKKKLGSNVSVQRSILKNNDLNTPTVSSNYCASPFKGMPFMKLSGCYECRMVVDPVLGFTKHSSLKASLCSCNICGEIFMKADYLELHQATRHAVSELGPEDTSKNIVEIIFQSSWLRKQSPICKIDRILKIRNTPKTIARFEEYRDAIKIKATKLPNSKNHSRCIADGNELLRFHSTTFVCSIGHNGSSALCNSIPNCGVCTIIKGGFRTGAGKGILTTASSGKAHDNAGVASGNEKRAMLVCRVIAGRVKNSLEGGLEEYDSVAGAAGVYSNLDELFVYNPRAILPCFLVIYEGF